MCRWLAYSGNAVPMSRLVYEPEHSLIDQSLSARSSVQTTNGDGFGVGWYDQQDKPGLYRNLRPAWNDPNLRDLCEHIESHLFLAHVRAATATPVQQTNCHPFRHNNWLFVHNGVVRDFARLQRDMAMAIDPALYGSVLGSTDSELMFYLALTFGLADDPYEGIARMVGLIEDLASAQGIDHALQMTLGIADGESLYAVRYSSEGSSRTLFYSASIAAIRELIPAEHQDKVDAFGPQAISVVSEPFHSLKAGWHPVPESTFLTIRQGEVSLRDFKPIRPSSVMPADVE